MDLMCFNHPDYLHATGDKFCLRCGSQLVEKSRCSECGRDLNVQFTFCPRCGKKIEWSK
jgi:predicted amidophosphoribosyltransferase